ncbi:MAG: hypothetical protein ACKOFW_22355, partial [Planctomycetaceae bacterium]
ANTLFRQGQALARNSTIETNKEAVTAFRGAANCHSFLASKSDPIHRKLQGECLWYAARSAVTSQQPLLATELMTQAGAVVKEAAQQFRELQRTEDAAICDILVEKMTDWTARQQQPGAVRTD